MTNSKGCRRWLLTMLIDVVFYCVGIWNDCTVTMVDSGAYSAPPLQYSSWY